MIKVLFMIHDLGQGGAEKVLVNLVNNMDQTKFDITVMALFGGGINEQFLKKDIRYITVFPKAFPGNSHVMKLFSPKALHKLFVKDKYDIEISYLEGPAARIISGCPDKDTKLLSWVHCTMHDENEFSVGFRNCKEAEASYMKFDKCIFVSKEVKESFLKLCHREQDNFVLYNTNESDVILEKAKEEVQDEKFNCDGSKLCAMGRIIPVKGFDRLIRIHKRLIDENYDVQTYILGIGPQQKELEKMCSELAISDSFHFMGYQKNPYKYLSKSDIFVCSSWSEGFSTAVTEALILGIPVVTTEVSGMKELLGENNEFGMITENDEEKHYQGIKKLICNPELLKYYREKAIQRGKIFNKTSTLKEVEEFLNLLLKE